MTDEEYPTTQELIDLLHRIEDAEHTTAGYRMADNPASPIHSNLINDLRSARHACLNLIRCKINDPDLGPIVGYLLSNRDVRR